MYNVLLINALVYIFTLLFSIYRQKELNMYVLVWLLNTVIAVSGYLCVENGYYYSTDSQLGYKLSIVPYIFVYLTIFLMTYPIKNINFKATRIDSYSKNRILKYLVYLGGVVNVALSIMKGSEAYITSQIGFGEAYAVGTSEGGSLVTYSNPLLALLSGWGTTFSSVFMPIFVLLYISRLYSKDGHKILNIVGIVISFLPHILNQLSHGSKGGLFFVFFDVIFFYILFKHLLSKKLKKTILLLGVILTALLVMGAYIIDEGRIETRNSDKEAKETLITYMGESMVNIGYIFYDKVRQHPNGRRFYPELFGKNERRSQDDNIFYWHNYTGVEIQMFKTFWGDCYIEFSLFGSIIYILILYAIWERFVLRKCYKTYILPLFFYYYHYFLIWGIFSHGFTGTKSHIMFIYLVIACVILKINDEGPIQNIKKQFRMT